MFQSTRILVLVALAAAYASSAPAVTLDNGTVAIEFRDSDYGLERLSATGFDILFDADCPLWSVEIYDPTLDTLQAGDIEEVLSTMPIGTLSHIFSGDDLLLNWQDMNLAGWGFLDVTVSVSLPPGEDLARLGCEVTIDGDRYSIWAVNAPRLRIPADGGGLHLDRAVMPTHAGCLVEDPAHNLSLNFNRGFDLDPTQSAHNVTHPGAVFLQQYHLYDAVQQQGLLWGTEDEEGWIKRLPVVGDGDGVNALVRHYPIQDGATNMTWSQPYPVILKPFEGDWIDAARDYRQRMADMSWMEPGPLYQRSDLRESIVNHNVTATFYMAEAINMLPDSKVAIEDVLDYMGSRTHMATHGRRWDWHEFCFTTSVIDPEIVDFWAFLDSLELSCAPYTSTRDLPDDMYPGFLENWNATVYNGEGVYSTEFTAYIMCPGSGWRDHYPTRLSALLEYTGVTDLYCDNYPKPSLCHHPEHDHAPGGGTYWIDGYRHFLGQVRDGWPETAFANESRCELLIPWLDVFPVHLWDQNDPGWFCLDDSRPIPLASAVYHDRTRPHGTSSSLWDEQQPQTFCFEQAWGWVNGTAMTIRFDLDLVEDWPADRLASYNFLREMLGMENLLRDHSIFGRWERPPVMEGFGEVSVEFDEGSENPKTWTGSPVLGGSLVSPSERLAVYLANFTDEARSGTVRIDLLDAGVGIGPWVLWYLDEGREWEQIGPVSGNPVVLDVDMAPLEVRVYRFLAPGDMGVGDDEPSPAPLRLAARPNPFNPKTTLSFTLRERGPVILRIFDIAGREVACPLSATLSAGEHRYSWDACGEGGHVLPSGIYVAKLETASQAATSNLLMLK